MTSSCIAPLKYVSESPEVVHWIGDFGSLSPMLGVWYCFLRTLVQGMFPRCSIPEYQTIIHRVEGASALRGFQGGGSGSFDFTSRNKALQKTMLQEEACESDESEDDIPVSERLKAMRRQKPCHPAPGVRHRKDSGSARRGA